MSFSSKIDNKKNVNHIDNELSFFDEEVNIKMAEDRLFRRKMFKIGGLILLGASATGYSIYYGLNKYMEGLVEDFKVLSKNSRVDDVLKNLKDLRESANALNLETEQKLKQLKKDFELAEMFNLKSDMQRLDNSRQNFWKDFQVELETNMNNIKNLKQHLDKINDKDFNKNINILRSLKDLLEDLEKGFENPKGSNQSVFVHYTNLLNVNEHMKDLESQAQVIKEEVVATILQKVKSGDYNLSATSNALIEDIKENSKEKDKEILEIYNEIKGTEFEKDFNSNDVKEAKKSVIDLENSIVEKVIEDQNKVKSLIDDLKTGKVSERTLTGTSSETSKGWGVFEYYLLYNWLSGGSRSTPAMAASHTSNFANTSGTKLQKTKNGAYVPPVTINQKAVASMSRVAVAPNYNSYNVRNKNSYINNSIIQSAEKNPLNTQKFKDAERKLGDIKVKGEKAASARRAELHRIAVAKRETERRERADRERRLSGSSFGNSNSRSSSRSSIGISRRRR